MADDDEKADALTRVLHALDDAPASGTIAAAEPADVDDRLFEVLLANGTLETDFKHKKRYERERMAYRARLSIKETKRERAEEARA